MSLRLELVLLNIIVPYERLLSVTVSVTNNKISLIFVKERLLSFPVELLYTICFEGFFNTLKYCALPAYCAYSRYGISLKNWTVT
jgi:hypothetical protein